MPGDAHLPSGMEPFLGGDKGPQLSGMEPELGGSRRFKADPRLVAMLLGRDDERAAASAHIVEEGLARLYAFELVKILSSREARRLRGQRWGYAHTTAQRIAATRALEIFGQEAAIEALVEALGDPAWWVGQYAIEALIATGPPAVERVIEALNHESPIVRRRAADVLGLIGDRRAMAPLSKAIEDEQAWVRLRVVQALGRLSDSRSTFALQKATQDTDGLVAMAAAEALRQIGANAAAR